MFQHIRVIIGHVYQKYMLTRNLFPNCMKLEDSREPVTGLSLSTRILSLFQTEVLQASILIDLPQLHSYSLFPKGF